MNASTGQQASHEMSAARELASGEPLLRLAGISKRFGNVTALSEVDMAIDSGQLVALVGDNGAGKSTLVSVISGLVRPDAGQVFFEGQSMHIESPQKAQQLGIATAFQDLALVDQRDVASNLFLGREPRKWGLLLDRRAMIRDASTLLSRLRVQIPTVRASVGTLSGGQRQSIAVARAVMRGTRLLILDEPTAALGAREAGRVLDLMRELHSKGETILFISHSIDNVMELADRVIVMRLGRKIADLNMGDTDRDEVLGLIIGGRGGQDAENPGH